MLLYYYCWMFYNHFIVILYHFLVLTYWHSAQCQLLFSACFFTSQEMNIKRSPNAAKLLEEFFWARRHPVGQESISGLLREEHNPPGRAWRQARPGGLCPPRVPPWYVHFASCFYIDIYCIMGCYFTLCHNTYGYSLSFYKVYMKRENAGSWNSGLEKEQILETYSMQLQKSWNYTEYLEIRTWRHHDYFHNNNIYRFCHMITYVQVMIFSQRKSTNQKPYWAPSNHNLSHWSNCNLS